ncbi:MAG: AraC family transcriptional regulator ligand-binding domain-containing protein, partial [Gammaproteobacteria bacterium]
MRPITLSRRQQLLDYLEPLDLHGYSLQKVLNREGLSKWLYGAPDDWVPLHCAARVMNLAAQVTGDDHYGFRVAELGSVDNIHTIGKAVTNSVSVYHSLRLVCSLIRYHSSNVDFWLADGTEDEDKIWFCRSEPPGAEVASRHLEQYVLLKMLQVARLGLGPTWTPVEIQLQTKNAKHIEKWETFGRVTIQREQPWTAIAIPRSALGLPVRNSGGMSIHQVPEPFAGDKLPQ